MFKLVKESEDKYRVDKESNWEATKIVGMFDCEYYAWVFQKAAQKKDDEYFYVLQKDSEHFFDDVYDDVIEEETNHIIPENKFDMNLKVNMIKL